MTLSKEQKLFKKILEKAIKNGYKLPSEFKTLYDGDGLGLKGNWLKDRISVEEVIFSHDFAEAFWGNKRITKGEQRQCKKCNYYTFEFDRAIDYWQFCPKCGGKIVEKEIELIEEDIWQYHLQQMVLVKDKLKYIEKFL